MVIINTVVIVRGSLGLGQRDVAFTLAAFGGGSILAALTLPRILDRISDRTIMIAAASAMAVALGILAVITASMSPPGPGYWHVVLVGWFLLGIAYSMSVTPSGRLLKRSANADDRPALFAAQFALSHMCWLICYPLVGQLGARVGMTAAFAGMAIVAGVGTVLALWFWPRSDPDSLPHDHADLATDDPHLRELHGAGGEGHAFVIDDAHPRWPKT
jgi:predicted MFS family arabinose efflux permease